MRILRKGSVGNDVKEWQQFLIGQGLETGEANGVFDDDTESATGAFQGRYGLDADGEAGPATLGKAVALGFGHVDDDDPDETNLNWPPRPNFLPLVGTEARQAVFGKFDYAPAPVPGNMEAIRMLGTWESDNIVSVNVPQLQGVIGAPGSGNVQFHSKVSDQFLAIWADWESAGLLSLILTWAGSFAPRFIRGSTTTLSNHAFGTAFDINAQWNPLGARPAIVGQKGSTRKLVEIANSHGFYWGGHFLGRTDGMHFEAAKIL